jgi:hypothetical protein
VQAARFFSGLENDLCRLGLDHVPIEQRLGKIRNLPFGDLGL